jgi:hypothetical protein
MRRLGAAARSARTALPERDRALLGHCIDDTFDLRAGMLDLDPRCVEIISMARGCGASANYTGSGGAIVVVSPRRGRIEAAEQGLEERGCRIDWPDPRGRDPATWPSVELPGTDLGRAASVLEGAGEDHESRSTSDRRQEMARIRITAEPLGGPDLSIVLDERITRNNFDSDHFAAALVERIGWALADADELERNRPR